MSSLLLLADGGLPLALVDLAPPPPQRVPLEQGVARPRKLVVLSEECCTTYQHEKDHARQHDVHSVRELLCLETHGEGENLLIKTRVRGKAYRGEDEGTVH